MGKKEIIQMEWKDARKIVQEEVDAMYPAAPDPEDANPFNWLERSGLDHMTDGFLIGYNFAMRAQAGDSKS